MIRFVSTCLTLGPGPGENKNSIYDSEMASSLNFAFRVDSARGMRNRLSFALRFIAEIREKNEGTYSTVVTR